ncbi:hypothetical protein J5N97_005659 [Dioscorea zingiberensis]|uniref:Uncharacterized protein n=1 Tax=Dioscorea zingiberensis TaxID=325984 RepID=A0A9D5HSJ5_9LILI|nr:hypothetical protein J5N97_005659 [Dioscorea zingiberensis]
MVTITSNLIVFPNVSSVPKSRCHGFFSSSRLDLAANRRVPGTASFGDLSGGARTSTIGFHPPRVAIAAVNEETYDPELRSVLELATDEELFELENILYGPSYFSPLLKSITSRPDIDYLNGEEDIEGRDDFIAHLEARFLFLAADARSTLRGWRPSYRNVLLGVRRKLGIPCPSKLSTQDLEVEIFLHLLQEYSSQETGSTSFSWEDVGFSDSDGSLETGLSRWKVHALASLKVGAKELRQIILKGGGMLALSKIYQLLANKLSGKMLLEAANCEIKHEIIRRGGQLAAINLESRAALLTARQGLARAASRYLGLRSMMMLVGPVLWGTFVADIVIQNLGTDYARILRAIYAFAQIRLTRTYGWTSSKK